MTPFLQLIFALAIIIFLAKFGGYLSYRIGQPAVLGELIIGIILGPSLINILALPPFTDPHLPETITHLAELGVLLLMFIAGLDLHVSDLLHTGKVAAFAGTLGVVAPIILGFLTGIIFSMDYISSLYIGLILSATSVSISAQTLMELKVLRSRLGVGLLGAAVFDDILVLLILAIFTALVSPISGGWLSIIWTLLKMVIFLGAASLLGWWILPKLSRRISRLPISQGLVSFSLVVLLFYGWSAEIFGHIAAITGAFLAGLWLGRSPEKERIQSGLNTLAYAFFVPIFFINIGLSANGRLLNWETDLLLLVMVVIAVVSKLLGSGLGALMGGFSRRESLQLGLGMISRGEVGLIVATIGVEQGLIQEGVFSAVVGVVIITTLLTPVVLRASFSKKPPRYIEPVKPFDGDGV